jgi:hypothetical protein
MVRKIAFLFLVYDQINHEDLWKLFFDQDTSNRHTIHIHQKTPHRLVHYNAHVLPDPVDTRWGNISLVWAQNLLLGRAILDPHVTHFIFCSNSCVPLKPFNHVFATLDPTRSYFNYMPDSWLARCARARHRINPIHIRKASQWCVLNRRHVELLLRDPIYLDWFADTVGDEHCYITYLDWLGLASELVVTTSVDGAENGTTFVNWRGIQYKYAHRSGCAKEYYRISDTETAHLIRSKCLFGRKFMPSCDLRYLAKNLRFLGWKHTQS